MTIRRPHRAVVVAHPDDEALWLSAAVATAAKVVFCFGDVFQDPERSRARQRAVEGLPLNGLANLAIPESGVDWKLHLAQPEFGPAGIRVSEPCARARYERNFGALLDRLRSLLAGCQQVYTHNPWGEYGHPEHVQVYRAVSALQAELGYDVSFSNYVGRQNWNFVKSLAGQQRWTRREVLTPDVATARRLMQVYRQHGAWTWTPTHRWPEREVMYTQTQATSSAPGHPFSGEWLLDAHALRWWPPPWHGPWRHLDRHERRARALPVR